MKHWYDDSDKFGFRPAVPTGNDADPLGLELKTRVTGTNDWVAPKYVLSQTAADRISVNDANNTWTYIYKKLLKSDASNKLYEFQITEKPGGTEKNVDGYRMPNYNESYSTDDATKDQKRTIVSTNNNNPLENNDSKAWDGTHPLTTTMDITNKLDTRDIIVTKTWKDNGYGGETTAIPAKLHYKTEITLEGTGLTWKVGNEMVNHSESKYLTKEDMDAGKGVVFSELPKYNSSGAVITYKVTEKLDSDDSHSTNESEKAIPGQGVWTNYCDQVTENGTTTDRTATATKTTEFVQKTGTGERQYGYNGEAVKYLKAETHGF